MVKGRKSKERKRFEELLAEVKALQVGAEEVRLSTRAAGPRTPWMALVDIVVLGLVLYLVIVGTPVGSLLRQGIGWMIDSPSGDVRPLLSYFSQPSQSKIRLATLQGALRRGRKIRRAEDGPVDDPLPVAVAFLLSEGHQAGKYFDVRLNDAAQRGLASVAIIWPGDAATAKQREDALYQGLERLRQHLGTDEGAVAALVVDPDSLAFALQRAQVSGDAHPDRFEAFSRYLTHDDKEEAGPLVHSAFALTAAYTMAWPIAEKARVTSRFGYRVHPVLGQRRLHRGVDLGVPIGTPVLAAQSGEVTFAGADGVNGRFMRIDHGHGLTTTYCHLDKHRVQRGDEVRRGQAVADSGNTGRSTGPHLHFQVEFGGAPVDPELFR